MRKNWPIFLILLLAAFLRLYRLPELTTFAGDQGIDLLVVKRMVIDHRWTLLGPKTSIMSIYNGPIYYYLISPVLYLSGLNPLSVSYFMVCLWLGAIFLTHILGKEIFSRRAGALAALLFSLWPIAIEYSRPSFNSFPTPFFAALFLLGVLYFSKYHRRWGIILAGLCSGVLMQLHYFNFFLIFFSLIFLFYRKKFNLKLLLLFAFCALATFSPMIVFELRHNFFNLRTLFSSLASGGVGDFTWQVHYAIAFFPLAFVALGRLLEFIWRKAEVLGIALSFLMVFFFASNIDLQRNHGYTMPEGWDYRGVKKAGEIIASDAEENFNVASIIDGDTRAYPFRYIIEAKGKRPLGVENYPEAETLYIISRLEKEAVLAYPAWEIQSFLPARVAGIWPLQNNYQLLKLVKERK
jgi:4-amino-4-deoxy-L-arabinose transferase-like glycosyltransferase